MINLNENLIVIDNMDTVFEALDLSESAKSDARALKHSELSKETKKHINAAHKYHRKGDNDQAANEYKAAITGLQKMKEEAKNIEDDTELALYVETGIRLVVAALLAISAYNKIKSLFHWSGYVTRHIHRLNVKDFVVFAEEEIRSGIVFGSKIVGKRLLQALIRTSFITTILAKDPTFRKSVEKARDRADAKIQDGKHIAYTRNQIMDSFDKSIKACQEGLQEVKSGKPVNESSFMSDYADDPDYNIPDESDMNQYTLDRHEDAMRKKYPEKFNPDGSRKHDK